MVTKQSVNKFPQGKENYCPQCYFLEDKVVLRKDCLGHKSMPITKQSIHEEFEKEFVEKKICRACGLNPCGYHTTGCPWYDENVIFNKADGGFSGTPDKVKSFYDTQIQKLLDQIKKEVLRIFPEKYHPKRDELLEIIKQAGF